MRQTRLGLALAVMVMLACTTRARREDLSHLGAEEKTLYSKYRQFMTDLQRDEFLALPSEEARRSYVEALNVEARLAHYPENIQRAIWAQEIVPGMDVEAVLLTWGSPQVRQVDEGAASLGQMVESWNYRRGDAKVELQLASGVVQKVNWRGGSPSTATGGSGN